MFAHGLLLLEDIFIITFLHGLGLYKISQNARFKPSCINTTSKFANLYDSLKIWRVLRFTVCL